MNKEDNSYKTISEVVKILNLKSKKGDSLPTHTLRFWEKEFKQIKPKILNGNRPVSYTHLTLPTRLSV